MCLYENSNMIKFGIKKYTIMALLIFMVKKISKIIPKHFTKLDNKLILKIGLISWNDSKVKLINLPGT